MVMKYITMVQRWSAERYGRSAVLYWPVMEKQLA